MNFFSLAFSALSIFTIVGCQTIDRTSPVARREVRDQSMIGKNDSGGPRKRLIVLPFLDASEGRPESLRDKARSIFIKELNRGGDVVAVDSRDLKQDSLRPAEKGEYDLKEIAMAAQALGANAVLEGKILDIRISRKADNVGVIRQMKSEFEAVVRVRVVQVRGGQEVFN
ncbi:MAG: hypothetical protein H7326_09850, partial [Bdellovibrionaceae bacterium]|nr:hypothetical protein [Pseudobdellovibrionaceae bacterium]